MTTTRRARRSVLALGVALAFCLAIVGCSDDDDDAGGTDDTTGTEEAAGSVEEQLDAFALEEAPALPEASVTAEPVGDFSFESGAEANVDVLFNPDTALSTRQESTAVEPVEVNAGISIIPAEGWAEYDRGDWWVGLAPEGPGYLWLAAEQLTGELPAATDIVDWEMGQLGELYADIQQGAVEDIAQENLGEGVASAATTVWQGTYDDGAGNTGQVESQVIVFVLDDGRYIIFETIDPVGGFQANAEAYNAMLGGILAAPVDQVDDTTTTEVDTTEDTSDTSDTTDTSVPDDGGIGLLPPPSGE